jgi:hypothetical protein
MASKKAHNALTHGLYAREAVLTWEDATKFEAFAQAIHDELKPNGPLEEEAVREVAELHWRKQRLALGYLLQYYKSPPSAELVAAAKGGLASLAAYLQAEAPARTFLMAGMQALDYVKGKLSGRGDGEEQDQCMPHPTPPKHDPSTVHGVVECAYDPVGLDHLLKVEMKIDSRIAKIMARLVGLKEYKRLYCRDSVLALPPAITPPLAVEYSADQPALQTGGSPQTDESQKPKVRTWVAPY